MNWTKGPNPAEMPSGADYYSAECIVWHRDKAPLCKYIIRRIIFGKGSRWMLYQWQPDSERYAPVPYVEQESSFARLYHAQDRAAWLERKDARAGVKPDHSSPIEAAAMEFETYFEQNDGGIA